MSASGSHEACVRSPVKSAKGATYAGAAAPPRRRFQHQVDVSASQPSSRDSGVSATGPLRGSASAGTRRRAMAMRNGRSIPIDVPSWWPLSSSASHAQSAPCGEMSQNSSAVSL